MVTFLSCVYIIDSILITKCQLRMKLFLVKLHSTFFKTPGLSRYKGPGFVSTLPQHEQNLSNA